MTPPRLMEQVRAEIRARHYSRRTEDAYIHWIRRFIVFHCRRHPRELGAPEVSAFVIWLALAKHHASPSEHRVAAGESDVWRREYTRAAFVLRAVPAV